ncbi:MAG: hypothetical protein ACTHND_18155 [Asticcacaulis sp.]
MAVSYGTNKAVTKGIYSFQGFSCQRTWMPCLAVSLEVSLGLQATGGLCFTHVTHPTPDNRSPEAVMVFFRVMAKKQTSIRRVNATSTSYRGQLENERG